MVMDREGDDGYPDRQAWPGYWRAIRTAAVWLLVGLVVIGGGAFLPRPDGLLARFVMEALIGLAAIALATFLAARANAWWDRKHA
jgi:hypothetical protein